MKPLSLDEVLKKYLPSGGGRLLDFGCAGGDLFARFEALGIEEIHGVETDPTFKTDRVIVTSDSLAYLNERKEFFDIIFTRQVLYYFERDQQKEVFRSLYRALKPGGTLIVVVYNGAVFTSRWIYHKDLDQKMTFNEISLRKLSVDQGFAESLIIGVKPTARTLIGNIILALLHKLVRFRYSILYFSERGRDPWRPRHFTPDIALIARK